MELYFSITIVNIFIVLNSASLTAELRIQKSASLDFLWYEEAFAIAEAANNRYERSEPNCLCCIVLWDNASLKFDQHGGLGMPKFGVDWSKLVPKSTKMEDSLFDQTDIRQIYLVDDRPGHILGRGSFGVVRR